MICSRCQKDFSPETNPGGLLFGAPTPGKNGEQLVSKTHLCAECTDAVLHFVKNREIGIDVIRQLEKWNIRRKGLSECYNLWSDGKISGKQFERRSEKFLVDCSGELPDLPDRLKFLDEIGVLHKLSIMEVCEIFGTDPIAVTKSLFPENERKKKVLKKTRKKK